MTLINLLVAPIRRVANFPLFQLMTAIAVILLLQAADSRSRRNIQRAPWRRIPQRTCRCGFHMSVVEG